MRTLLAPLTLLLVVAATVPATGQAPPPIDTARIDVIYSQGFELYGQSLSGEYRTRLPFHDGESLILERGHGTVDWLPGGDVVVYADDEGVKSAALDGSREPVLLASGTQFFSVSPDGRHVALAGTEVVDGATELGLLPLDDLGRPDGPLQRLDPTDAVQSLGMPVWAPDGSAFAFTRGDPATPYLDLVVAELSVDRPLRVVEERRLMAREDYLLVSRPAWTPDATSLVISAVPRLGQIGTPRALYEVSRTGGIQKLLGGTIWQPDTPLVSPDGQEVLYLRNCYEDRTIETCTATNSADSPEGGVWALDLATRAVRQVAQIAGREFGLTITPDGQTAVFASSGGGTLEFNLVAAPTSGQGDALRLLDREWIYLGSPSVKPGISQQVSGPSRVETAVAVSRTTFPAATSVVLARADAYPDALAGSALAGSLGAPLLLTPTAELATSVAAEIRRLGATDVVILGDETAVSAVVADQLREMVGVMTIDRLAGPSRFDTAAAVAARLDATHGYVVLGGASDPQSGWPDAVAAAGLAALTGEPLLLVESTRIPEPTAALLGADGIEEVTIIGGEAAITPDVERALQARGVTVRARLGGATRYETSRLVAERTVQLVPPGGPLWLATGRDWPDTLAAGPAAAISAGVLLLVDGAAGGPGEPARAFISAYPAEEVFIAGGADVVAPQVRVAVEATAP
ncbi:cell wall-binding repeat-containing protein [Euzebya tangerina]|uniref:cell wall-binding repeat-containing protein n=1 Tax=Euzebya tangerina TaxID=591198 RepID=UPI000E31BE86|nr:cell wall-binding repeat-containing protein [Euzebya tangerina]